MDIKSGTLLYKNNIKYYIRERGEFRKWIIKSLQKIWKSKKL